MAVVQNDRPTRQTGRGWKIAFSDGVPGACFAFSILPAALHQDNQASSIVWKCKTFIQDHRRIYTKEKAKVVTASGGTEFLKCLAALAVLHQDDLKNRLICTLVFNSYCCKSAYSSIVLLQISLFFNSSWCKSAYSSTRPGVNQLILQLVLVQNSQRGEEQKKFCPPRSSTTFAFSSV